MEINYKKLNPVGFHLLSLLQDKTIRLIILYGGSSSGKTYSIAQLTLIMTLYDGENTLVMRKVGASISKTIYEDFKVASKQLCISSLFRYKDGVKQIVCISNGAKIDFGGLDDPEKIKGISNYKRVILDEWSEFDSEDFKQVRKRLRGKEGQQIITTFNPIKETHWIKKEVFDVDDWHDVSMTVTISGKQLPAELTAVKSIRKNSVKTIINPRTGTIEEHASDTVVIQTTYLNNFWVVGSPDGTYGYYDEQCIADFEKDRQNDPDYYNVYALGEWGVIRTGSEFFGSFNRGKHSGEVLYDPQLPVHISIDNNVLPYITCTYWQVSTIPIIRISQIGETCAETPNNTVRKSAKLVAERLRELAPYKVFLHGDASTRAATTIDEEKRSFIDLFIDTLHREGIDVEDCVSNKNPGVAMSGEFINSIFDGQHAGIEIRIGENCPTSIEDYMSVQKDVNGGILKTRIKNKITMQTYEEHGHISDTMRYVVCDVLKDEFTQFSNKRKRNLYAKDGVIHFFNPNTQCDYSQDVVYAMPNMNGKFVMVHGKMCGMKWHIVEVSLRETTSTEDIKNTLITIGSPLTVIECGEAYFMLVRELRKILSGVRVIREYPDIDRRIAATSDYVKSNILFNETLFNENAEYSEFMGNLLDYKRNGEIKEASAVLSGFIKFVIKSFSNDI